MSKLSDRLRQEIQTQKVGQTPAWVFWAKNSGWLVLIFLFVSLGIVAWGFIWYFGLHLEVFQELLRSPRKGLKTLSLGIPAVWLIVFGISLLLGSFAGRHSKKGYKWSALTWIWVLLLPQILGGFLFQQFNLAERLETVIESRLPFVRGLDARRDRFFGRPEDGFLIGRVEERVSETEIFIMDPQGNQWWVDLPQSAAKKIQKIGDRVALRGEIVKEFRFAAQSLRVLPPRRLKRRK